MKEKNIERFDYYGYIVYSNGDIFTSKGVPLKPHRTPCGTLSVMMRIPFPQNNTPSNKKKIQYIRKRISVAKLVYELCTGKKIDRYHNRICYKDNDKSNCSFENLYCTGLPSKKRLSAETAEKIRLRYKNNDRHFGNKALKDSPSLRDLAKEYGVTHSVIQKVVKGDY